MLKLAPPYFYEKPNRTYRIEGGIPPLVELLDFTDTKVQRAAAGALRTLAFKNDENKNQVVENSINFGYFMADLDVK